VRLLVDLNIAPRSATFLRSLGHDLIRVNEVLPGSTPDEQIVEFARAHGYTVLTQDLDFSAIVARHSMAWAQSAAQSFS
jgi:predicted nuclease of predicted toxin-antitoxin system